MIGESQRTLDEKHRLTLPPELADQLGRDDGECLLAKERPGCLSLWDPNEWQAKLSQGMQIVQSKIDAGRLEGRLAEVQALGRLLSTRHKRIPIAGRGRLVVPDGFRDFLGVEPGEAVVVVGAAVCIELWRPAAWAEFIGSEMPDFRNLFDQLTS